MCVLSIGLPDEAGRLEILQIHTSHMRAHGKLDKVDLNYLASKTRNFSGAEIEGLVRSAQATAMNKIIKVGVDVGVFMCACMQAYIVSASNSLLYIYMYIPSPAG